MFILNSQFKKLFGQSSEYLKKYLSVLHCTYRENPLKYQIKDNKFRSQKIKFIYLINFSIVSVSVASFWCHGSRSVRRDPGTGSPAGVAWDSLGVLDPTPIVLRSEPPTTRGLDEGRLASILRKVEPPRSALPASYCLHALSAHGLDASFADARVATGRDLLRVFTDDAFARSVLGAPAMLRTRHGIRPASQGGGRESHYDQTLGCLAQLGVPLSTPVTVGLETRSLRDVLGDSIASFELDEGEIEWTAIAYASYLPPRVSWANKFGDQFTFDQLVAELLERDLSQASCCGCHIVDALILLLRIDREVAPLLAAATRSRAVGRVAQLTRSATASQGGDGSWEPDWHRGLHRPVPGGRRPSDESVAGRLLATSHVVHWMMTLPLGERPSGPSLRDAIAWIAGTLADVKPDFVAKNYCPCSHGAWVLRIATRPGELGANRPLARRASSDDRTPRRPDDGGDRRAPVATAIGPAG